MTTLTEAHSGAQSRDEASPAGGTAAPFFPRAQRVYHCTGVPVDVQERFNVRGCAAMALLVEQMLCIGRPEEVRERLYRRQPKDRRTATPSAGETKNRVSPSESDDAVGDWPAVAARVASMEADELGGLYKVGDLPYAVIPDPWCAAPDAPSCRFEELMERQAAARRDRRADPQAPPPFASTDSAAAAGPSREETASDEEDDVPFRFTSFVEASERLMQLCTSLQAVLTSRRHTKMPSDLRYLVLLPLYAWVTDFRVATNTPGHWVAMADLFNRVAVRGRGAPMLPWRPLYTFLASLSSSLMGTSATLRMANVHSKLRPYLVILSARAAKFFGPDALSEMWSTVCPAFTPRSQDANFHLGILYMMVPLQHTFDRKTGLATPLVKHVVHFLFVETSRWDEFHGPVWKVLSGEFLSLLLTAHVGLLDMDAIAEPFFTNLLRMLELPVAETDHAYQVPRRHSMSTATVMGLPLLAHLKKSPTIVRLGAIANALPNLSFSSEGGPRSPVLTPLWNQLKRFLHTTSVFLRPGSASTSATAGVFAVYAALIHTACRRVRREAQRVQSEAYREYRRARRRQQQRQQQQQQQQQQQGPLATAAAATTVGGEATPLTSLSPQLGARFPLVSVPEGDPLLETAAAALTDGKDGVVEAAAQLQDAADFESEDDGSSSSDVGTDDDMPERPDGQAGAEAADARVLSMYGLRRSPSVRKAIAACRDARTPAVPRRPHPETAVWSRETVDVFVDLMTPCVIPALHLRLDKKDHVVEDLLYLSPARVFPHVQRYIDSAMNASSGNRKHVGLALRLLSRAFPALTTCAATADAFLQYLSTLLPQLTPYINPSDRATSHGILRLFALTATAYSLERDVFGSPEVECAVMAPLFESILRWFGVPETATVEDVGVAAVVLRSLSLGTYDHIMDRHVLPCVRGHEARRITLLLYGRSRRDSEDGDLRDVATGVPRCASCYVATLTTVAAPVLLSGASRIEDMEWAADVALQSMLAAGRDAVFATRSLLVRCIKAVSAQVTSATALSVAGQMLAVLVHVMREVTCRVVQEGAKDEGGLAPAAAAAEGTGPQDAEPDVVVSALEALDPLIMERRRMARRLGFCKAKGVPLSWSHPAEEHFSFLFDLYDDLVEDVLHVIRNVEDVHAPNSFSEGLRGLCAEVRAAPSPPVGTENSVLDAKEVTPSNVLLGCVSWLSTLTMCFTFLHHSSYGDRPRDMDKLEQRIESNRLSLLGYNLSTISRPTLLLPDCCPLSLPIPVIQSPSDSQQIFRSPKHSLEALARFVLHHTAQRAVSETALRTLGRAFGCDVSELLDVRIITSAKTPLCRQADGGESSELLEGLIDFVAFVGGLTRYEDSYIRDVIHTCAHEKLLLHATLSRYHLPGEPAPPRLWGARASSVVSEAYKSVGLTRRASAAFMGLCYNLCCVVCYLFPELGQTGSTAYWVVEKLQMQMAPPVRRIAVASHARLLRFLGMQWLRTSTAVAVRVSSAGGRDGADEVAQFVARTSPRRLCDGERLQAEGSEATTTGACGAVSELAEAMEGVDDDGNHIASDAAAGDHNDVEVSEGHDAAHRPKRHDPSASCTHPAATEEAAPGSRTKAARDTVAVAVRLTLSVFQLHYACEVPDVLLATLQTAMWLPDRLTAGGTQVRLRQLGARVASAGVPLDDDDENHERDLSEPPLCARCSDAHKGDVSTSSQQEMLLAPSQRSVKRWLVEEALLLASRLQPYSPTRAHVCLRIAATLWCPANLPHCASCTQTFFPLQRALSLSCGTEAQHGTRCVAGGVVLGAGALQALLRLCMSGFAQLQTDAVNLLEEVVAVVQRTLPATNANMATLPGSATVFEREVTVAVRMNRSSEAEDVTPGNLSAFVHRYHALAKRTRSGCLNGNWQRCVAETADVCVGTVREAEKLVEALQAADRQSMGEGTGQTATASMPLLGDRSRREEMSSFTRPVPSAVGEGLTVLHQTPGRLGAVPSAEAERERIQDPALYTVSETAYAYCSAVQEDLRRLCGFASLPEIDPPQDAVVTEEARRTKAGHHGEQLRVSWVYRLLAGFRDVRVNSGENHFPERCLMRVGTIVGRGVALPLFLTLAEGFLAELETLVVSEKANAAGVKEYRDATVRIVSGLTQVSVSLSFLGRPFEEPSTEEAAARAAIRRRVMKLFQAVVQLCWSPSLSPGETDTALRCVVSSFRALSFAEHEDLLDWCFPASHPGGHEVGASPPPLSESTQQVVSRYTAVLSVISRYSVEQLGTLFPHVLACLRRSLKSMTSQTSTEAGRFASAVLQLVLEQCKGQSDVLPNNGTLREAVILFAKELLTTSVAFYKTPSAEVPDHSLAAVGTDRTEAAAVTGLQGSSDAMGDPQTLPRDDPPSLDGKANDTREDERSPSSSHTPRDDEGANVSSYTSVELARMQCAAAAFFKAPGEVLEACHELLLPFLAQVLDVVHLHTHAAFKAAADTLLALGYATLSKEVVHTVLEHMCDVLEGKRPYGQSRRARLAVTKALRALLFTNTHRIGKFALMKRVAAAALAVMSHGDGLLRQQGQGLFAVLTRVASKEQTLAIVTEYEKELRILTATLSSHGAQHTNAAGRNDSSKEADAPSQTAAAVDALDSTNAAAKRRHAALLYALCATLDATPGAVPLYLPRLMERLVPYAEGGAWASVEVRQQVKKTFERWWASHREGWELEYKQSFTPAQLEALSVVFRAPSFYA